jgi:hypothetical protein
METKQTLINHLIKVLAKQIRHAESFNGMWGKEKERAEACRSASKTIALLEGYGVEPDIAFEAAEALSGDLVA